jgi:hypothetical protein
VLPLLKHNGDDFDVVNGFILCLRSLCVSDCSISVILRLV